MKHSDEAWRTQQIHTVRKSVGIVSLKKSDLVSIGELVGKEFPDREVAVFIGLPNQRTMILSKFQNSEESIPSTNFSKILIQKNEGDGFIRQITVEFGPHINFVEAQSIDESWAIGIVERICREIEPFELPNFLSFEGIGSVINAMIPVVLIAYIPSIPTVGQRVIYILILISVMVAVKKLHEYFVPKTLISLNLDKISRIRRFSQKTSSVIIGLIGAALTAFVTIKFRDLLGWVEAIVSFSGLHS